MSIQSMSLRLSQSFYGEMCSPVSLRRGFESHRCHHVIILNTISKRQDGLGFIGKNGYIFHDCSRCIEVPIGGAYAHMFEDLLQVISYNTLLPLPDPLLSFLTGMCLFIVLFTKLPGNHSGRWQAIRRL